MRKKWEKTVSGFRAVSTSVFTALFVALAWEGNLTTQGIVDALAEGKLVVAVMGKGHFTKGSHFIVLRGMTGEGKVLVSDPANYIRSTMEWELVVIVEEAAKAATAGGPFWAIGNNNEIE